jgi:hypothetical protein
MRKLVPAVAGRMELMLDGNQHYHAVLCATRMGLI